MLGELSRARDHPIDRIVGHDAAGPAGLYQLVTGDDPAIRPGKDHQDLHHPRLERLPLVTGEDLAGRGNHLQLAELERGFAGKHAPARLTRRA
jgi:hypothetical protein